MTAVGYTSGDDRKLNSDGGAVYALAPPRGSGLSAIAADGTTNDAATLQSHLTYQSGRGGGRVILPPAKRIKCTAGISIPDKVQLVSDESTVLDFATIGSGTALTVSGQDCTPLVGVRLEGPNTTADLADTSKGIVVAGGIGLRFYNTRVKYFGRGVDLAHSDTYILSFIGGDIGTCGTCIYADMEAASATTAGERLVFEHFTLYNSARGIDVTGGATQFHLTNCSIDNCVEFGRVLNPSLFLTGCHLETVAASGRPNYLFTVQGNSHVYMTNTDVIMGGGTGTLNNLFDPNHGPSNYGFGLAQFTNTSVYYVNPSAVPGTVVSDQLYSWPASTTTADFHTPFPLRWSTLEARLVATDTYAQPNNDQVQITAMGGSAGTFTLTTPSNGAQRWVLVTV